MLRVLKRQRMPSLAWQEARLAYIMILPTFLVVMLIIFLPVLWNIWLSFKPVRLGTLQKAELWKLADFTLKNYISVLKSRGFVSSLQVTLIYTFFGTVLSILLGLAAALLVREYFPGRNVFRGLLLFPYIAPVVAVAFVWKIMFNAQFGIVNELMVRFLGAQRISFFSLRSIPIHFFGFTIRWPLALSMVIFFEGWRYFPFAFLFILARLQALPEDLYEAAAVDGATLFQRFWYITLPQLRGVFATLFILRFIWTFNKFDDIFLLTGGAAGTKVLTIKIYEYLFGRYNIGAAAALSLILGVILAVFLTIYFRYTARLEE